MSNLETHILKFGGSSLKTRSLIQQSAQIVIDRMRTARPLVVVSALGGITNDLIELADQYPGDEQTASQKITALKNQHQQFFDELVSSDHPLRGNLQDLFGELQSTVGNHTFRNSQPRAWKDHILSFGERASAILFAAVLSQRDLPAHPFEAHHFVKTDSTFGKAEVNPALTRKLARDCLKSTQSIPVITGFIGSNSEQQITTLGRSGSDYTAGLVADALDADHLEIWTDVNGVLTADPQWVPTAEPIQELSFGDITELSAHGAKVIHPQTIRPIQHKDISVLVKNSQNPLHPGTLITSGFQSNGSLKTITVTGPFVRIQIDERKADALYTVLKQWLEGRPDHETLGYSRASTFEPACFLLQQSFFERIADRLAGWSTERNLVLDLQADLYKVKKFSNHFSKNEKLTRRIWNLLASNSLQPITAKRNRDQRFISFLFEKEQARLAARLLNDYLQNEQTGVNLFVAGTGAVGQTLLKKLAGIEPDGIKFRLLGTCNSRKTLWREGGLDLKSQLEWSDARPTDWKYLSRQLTQPYYHNLIFVDATGSKQVARLYPELLKNGAHIVTPSKLANTFEQSFFDELQSLVKAHDSSFRYETTVGAGLPIISTLEELTSSGDRITEISGVVSGTMTYLFNQLEQGIPFSKAIIDARDKGYAEPDPRDDLSGEDVARKFLTLARTLGLNIERSEVEVESLIPEALQGVNRDTFLKKLPTYDSKWQQRIRAAQESDHTLRYTGRLVDGTISIGIQSVPKDSPLGQLRGTDNLVQIYSDFYHQTPLVIQGPGAGKEVTAAGVLNDIIKTARSLS